MSTMPDVPQPNAVEIARRMAQQVRALIETLPGLVFITPEENRRLTASAAIPDRFLEATAAAMDESPALASSGKMTAAALRDAIQMTQAYVALADELDRLARGVRGGMKVHRAAAGTEALRVYNVARRLNRPRDSQSLVSTLNQMERALGRLRVRARATPDEVPLGAAGGA